MILLMNKRVINGISDDEHDLEEILYLCEIPEMKRKIECSYEKKNKSTKIFLSFQDVILYGFRIIKKMFSFVQMGWKQFLNLLTGV